ncbi:MULTISPECIES: hypothetical protein [unclassified Synechococcus]|nr:MULTISPECIES: hypothetical protein [unclassified Synechococcus]
MPKPLPDADQPSIGVGTWAWGNQFLWGYQPERMPANPFQAA